MVDTDRSETLAEIALLELEEHTISARRRRLHDRLAIFPNDAAQQAERELSVYRRELHRKIDTARARLADRELAADLLASR